MYCEQERSLEVCCVFLNVERHNFLVTDKALHQRVDSKKCGIYLNFALFNFSDTILPLSGSKIRIVLNIFDRYFQVGNFLELQRTLPAWCIENTFQTKSWVFNAAIENTRKSGANILHAFLFSSCSEKKNFCMYACV